MSEYLTIDGGALAYETSGADGTLVVLAHGIGDSRKAYRLMTPALVAAGYPVAGMDLRRVRRLERGLGQLLAHGHRR